MKIDFKKIDFRQGKYWFPLVLFVPLVAIAYFSCEMFKGPTERAMTRTSIARVRWIESTRKRQRRNARNKR